MSSLLQSAVFFAVWAFLALASFAFARAILAAETLRFEAVFIALSSRANPLAVQDLDAEPNLFDLRLALRFAASRLFLAFCLCALLILRFLVDLALFIDLMPARSSLEHRAGFLAAIADLVPASLARAFLMAVALALIFVPVFIALASRAILRA